MAVRDHSSKLVWIDVVRALAYDPETGAFTWRVSQGRQAAGQPAGTLKDGYLKIIIFNSECRAHRLAYFMVNMKWPPEGMFLDHVNRNRADNRWCNLRLASIADNTANASLRSDSTTGVAGVYAHKTNGRFYVSIRRHGVTHKLGGFATLEAAAAVRRAAEIEHFGAFAPNLEQAS